MSLAVISVGLRGQESGRGHGSELHAARAANLNSSSFSSPTSIEALTPRLSLILDVRHQQIACILGYRCPEFLLESEEDADTQCCDKVASTGVSRDKLLSPRDFDLVAGRSVISKSLVSILSPAMTSHEKEQSSIESVDPERSDPAVNVSALPGDHPIHLLNEARKLYGSERAPPFVLKKRSEVKRNVVIPTKNGSRPKDEKATKVNIVAKVCAL